MRALFSSQFNQVTVLTLLIALLVVVVIVVALCLKDRVRAGIHCRSFGFFLEASSPGKSPRRPKELN